MDYGKLTYNFFRLANENKNTDGTPMLKYENLDQKQKELWANLANYTVKLNLLQREFEGMIVPLENKIKEYDGTKE
jgi:hypothetical protein